MTIRTLVGHREARERLASAHQGGKLPQVLLLLGPAGVGRQRLALWLAQRLMCEGPEAVEPCGRCRGCTQVLSLSHPDLHWFVPVPRPKAAEPEKQADEVAQTLAEVMAERRERGVWGPPDGMALHGMGLVRLFQRRAALTAAGGGARVFILGDAERLIVQEGQQEAPNALLKLLEEPPPGMTIILTAADAGRLLPTVVSRAVPLRLQPLSPTELAEVLAVQAPESSAEQRRSAAALAAGSPGVALAKLLGLGRSKGSKAADADPLKDAEAMLVASRGREARALMALATGVAEARGRFTQTLDALAETLAEAARDATGSGARRPLPPALAEVQDPQRLVAALEAVQRTRVLAQGNVNPQLLTAVLEQDLAEALWR